MAPIYGVLAYIRSPGSGLLPTSQLSPRPSPDDSVTRQRQQRLDRERESADSHLRSSKEVIGYEIMATDGPIGSVENFVFDDKSWAIRYMVVDTAQMVAWQARPAFAGVD